MNKLMHKDTEVAKINNKKVTILNEELFPGIVDIPDISFNRWFLLRKNILNRQDLKNLLIFYGKEIFDSKSIKAIDDCYWIKDEKSDTTYNDIIKSNNNINNDNVFIAVISPKDLNSLDFESANLTLKSNKQAFWYKKDERLGQIVLNAKKEMDIYKIANKAEVDIFYPREYIILKNNIFTYIDINYKGKYERIPLEHLLYTVKENGMSNQEILETCCEKYNIKEWQSYIRKVLKFNKTVDETIKDSNYKIDIPDLMVLRDSETNEYHTFDKI